VAHPWLAHASLRSLITDFYEYGWGQSFHFAPRNRGESFDVRSPRGGDCRLRRSSLSG